MPALKNQRWERFCQLIVYGADVSQKTAYERAGYRATGNGSEANASRLLRIAKPVVDRIHELQQEQKTQLAKRDRYTRAAIAERLTLASQIAEEERNAAAMGTNEMAIAKLYGLVTDKVETKHGSTDFNNAQSLNDLGRMLLESVGLASPSSAAIAEALEAHGRMIALLEAIAERAQSDTAMQ